MCEMCDLTFSALCSTKEDFIKYKTLYKVNQIIANKINTLPVFKAWNLLDDKLLTDTGGQKPLQVQIQFNHDILKDIAK